MLNLPLEIINAFESAKVHAPIFVEEVEASLASALQKLAIFQEQGERDLAIKKQALLSGTVSLGDAHLSNPEEVSKFINNPPPLSDPLFSL